MPAAELASSVLSDADRRVLEFACFNRLVNGPQVVRLLGIEADDARHQLSTLVDAGVLVRERLEVGDAWLFRITSAGVAAIATRVAPPGFDHRIRHALGVGWLWLMACEGMFGAVGRVLTERQMRLDDLDGGVDAPFAARPDEFGGRAEKHYPNLVLLTGQSRIAVELMLTAPAPAALEPVLRAYAADVRVSGVLYLVRDPWVGRFVQSVAAWIELSPIVHVQQATIPLG